MGSGSRATLPRLQTGQARRDPGRHGVQEGPENASRLKLIFDPEALEELQDAARFYEDSRSGLGGEFLDAVQKATSGIVRNPLLWRSIAGQYRRRLVQRFPYALIYTIHQDSIYIAAVMHLRRKPGYWFTRTARSRG
jgi:toxin ParE1/3/4